MPGYKQPAFPGSQEWLYKLFLDSYRRLYQPAVGIRRVMAAHEDGPDSLI